MAITKYELGGIRHIEVRLPDRPAVTVARDDENLNSDELEKRAIAYWQGEDRITTACEQLRQKYNTQVYVGTLPVPDINTDLEGYYAYVLKDRRSKGKYQIADAVNLT